MADLFLRIISISWWTLIAYGGLIAAAAIWIGSRFSSLSLLSHVPAWAESALIAVCVAAALYAHGWLARDASVALERAAWEASTREKVDAIANDYLKQQTDYVDKISDLEQALADVDHGRIDGCPPAMPRGVSTAIDGIGR